MALAKALADAELKLLKDALDRQSRDLDEALDGRLISLADYYAAKTALETREIDAEIARTRSLLAEQQRSATSGSEEGARLKAKAEVAKIEADLIVLNNKRADVEVANARKALEAERGLREELARVRAQGHALVDQEFEPGLRTVAVPLRNRRGEVVASMNVSVHAARVSIPDLLDRCLPMLLQAQEQLKPLL